MEEQRTKKGERGLTRLELAIILTALVVVGIVFAFACLAGAELLSSFEREMLSLVGLVKSSEGWTLYFGNGEQWPVSHDVVCWKSGDKTISCRFPQR